MAIKVISFDLDGTLWDVWPVIAQAEQDLHAWLAPRHPPLVEHYTPEALRLLCRDIAMEQPELAHDKTALRKGAIRRAALATGAQAQEAGELAERGFEVFFAGRNRIPLFEDVLPVLETLARDYTLAALSNGNADLDRVGIGHLFRLHYHAGDAGFEKPHPRMFEMLLETLRVQPGEVLHVGDEVPTDIVGANRVGMKTVLIERGLATPPPADPAPDHTLPNLRGLQSIAAGY